MQETIEKCRSERGVIVENLSPLLKRSIGSQYDGAALITLGDDLEEQIRTEFVDWKVADFVAEEQ
jgi:hypothetical protein